MKKIAILIITLLCCAFSNAQKEASNWYFGDKAGISFNIDADTVTAVSDGELSTEEGCTSISDTNGNLLFYTDGRTAYNANHTVMPNGNGLKGDASSTQSAIIIPKPNDPNIYYIFTVDSDSIDGSDFGFNLYEVNMTLDGGLGDIVAGSETQLINNTSEKLSAVLKDCDSGDIWVITFANSSGFSNTNNTFFAYQVTDAGVNTTPVTSPAGISTSEARGYLKFSPDGTKIIFRSSRPKTEQEIKEYKELLAEGLVEPTDMELYICNADGSDLRQLTDLGNANWSPFFHPSGKKILFSSNFEAERGFPFNLYLIDIDGKNLERVTHSETFDAFPVFSNDGKYLAFSSNRNNVGGRDTNLFIAEWQD